jgi:hypothetical protein
MPLRRTERSDGRQRPRWKDGSHGLVESTCANESRRDEIALEQNTQTEPLVELPPLLGRTYEHEVSTRDRPARTGADARIEESVVMGEVRLALRPYGRRNNGGSTSDNVQRVNSRGVFESVSLRRCNPMAGISRGVGAHGRAALPAPR